MRNFKYFCWGILAGGGALFMEASFLILSGKDSLPDDFWEKITLFMAVFVFLEEFVKFVFAEKIIFQEKGTVFEAGIMGAGFGFLETGLNFWKGLPENPLWLNFLTLLGTFSVHILTALLAGSLFFFQKKRGSSQAISVKIGIFSILFLLHFLYNTAIIKLL